MKRQVAKMHRGDLSHGVYHKLLSVLGFGDSHILVRCFVAWTFVCGDYGESGETENRWVTDRCWTRYSGVSFDVFHLFLVEPIRHP